MQMMPIPDDLTVQLNVLHRKIFTRLPGDVSMKNQ